MRTKLYVLLALVAPAAFASGGGGVSSMHATMSATTASLQRGARNFVNYCLGCHAAKYVRYNRMAADLGITEEQLIGNLMFTGERPFDTMQNGMNPEDAKRWFGVRRPTCR